MYEQLSDQELELVDSACESFEDALRSDIDTAINSWVLDAPETIRGILLQELFAIKCQRFTGSELDDEKQKCISEFPQFEAEIADVVNDLKNAESDKPSLTTAAGRRHQKPKLPKTIGRFQIESEIGRGGMGVVYLAKDEQLKRTVAIKVLLGAEHSSKEATERFLKEAETAARLQLENVVRVFEVGEHNGHPYMTLEYVDGPNLARFVNGQPQNQRAAAYWMRSLAMAMAQAHLLGIVHRDLKPANVLVKTNQLSSIENHNGFTSSSIDTESSSHVSGQDSIILKITDFGLAKDTGTNSELTATGAVVGTPQFMSPEQALGNTSMVGPLSDIYSLGAILYFLLTGRPPFLASTHLETLLSVQKEEPLPPSSMVGNISRDLETICLRCLDKKPERRFQSAAALSDELDRFLNNRPILSRPISRLQRAWRWCQNNRAVASLLTSVLLVLAIGVATTSWKWLEAIDSNRELLKTQGELRKETKAAKEATQDAKDADLVARRERDASRLRESSLTFEKALDIANAGDVNTSLAWMANALSSLPEPAEYQTDDHRKNIAAIENVIRINMNAWLPFATQRLAKSPEAAFFDQTGNSILYRIGKKVIVWSPFSPGSPVQSIEFDHEPLNFWLDDSQTYLVAVVDKDESSALILEMNAWNLKTGQKIGTIMQMGQATSHRQCLFASKDRVLVRLDKFVCTWNLKTGEAINKPRTIDCKTLSLMEGGDFFCDNELVWETNTIARVDPSDDRLKGLSILNESNGRAALQFVGSSEPSDGAALNLVDRVTGVSASDLISWQHQEYSLWRDGEYLLTRTESNDWLLQNPFDASDSIELADDFLRISQASNLVITKDSLLQLPQHFLQNPESRRTSIPRASAAPSDTIYSADGEVAVTRRKDVLHIVGTIDNYHFRHSIPHPIDIKAFTVSKDGDYVATAINPVLSGDIGGEVFVWDAKTGEKVSGPLIHFNSIGAMTFSPDGKYLVAGDYQGWIRFWDTHTGLEIRDYLRITEIPWALRFNKSGDQLIVGTTPDRTKKPFIEFFDVHNEFKSQAKIQVDGGYLKFDPFETTENKTLVASANQIIYFVDAATLSQCGKWTTGDKHQDLRWTRNRNRVAAITRSNEVSIYDIDAQSLINRPIQLEEEVELISLGYDGEILATVSDHHEFQLWDVATAMPLGPAIPIYQKCVGIRFDDTSQLFSMTTLEGETIRWRVANAIDGDLIDVIRKVQKFAGVMVGDEFQVQALPIKDWPSIDDLRNQVGASSSFKDLVIQHSPENKKSLEIISQLKCESNGNFPVALTRIDSLVSRNQARPWKALKIAFDTGDERLIGDAISALDPQDSNQNINVLQDLSIRYMAERQWKRARACLDKLSVFATDNWQSKRMLSNVLLEMGNRLDADDSINIASELCDDPLWLPWFINQQFPRNNTAAILTLYERFSKFEPFSLPHSMRYGRLLVTVGDHDKFRKFVSRRIHNWYPNHKDFPWQANWRYVWLACLAPTDDELTKKISEIADSCYEEMAATRSMAELGASTKSLALLRTNQWEEVVEFLSARTTAGNHMLPYQNIVRGIALCKLGRIEEAQRVFDKTQTPIDIEGLVRGELAILYVELEQLLKDASEHANKQGSTN